VTVVFPNTMDVRLHSYAEGVVWEVLAPLYAIYDGNTLTQRIKRVPSGQFTDFASVPRLPIVYLCYADKFHMAALFHDLDYGIGGTEADFHRANYDFLAGMLATVTEYQTESDARAMYAAVCAFGAAHFNYR
jgi:hypothetical protein